MRQPSLIKIAALLVTLAVGWLGTQGNLKGLLHGFFAEGPSPTGTPHSQGEIDKTLALIDRGGPFPHRQDGSVFQNRERQLPAQPRGYYHEYTVRTPGLSNRGPRRIITGGNPPVIFYYTEDHYRTFRILEKRP